MGRIPTAAAALVLSACATPAHSAENLPARVAAAPNGTVAFSYPARPGVCGDGRTFIMEMTGSGQRTFYRIEGTVSGNFQSNAMLRCSEGPARVVLTKRAGRIADLDVYVGPKMQDVNTDLGDVSAQEAADYLLQLARELPRHASEAFMAAAIGDGVRISAPLLTLARDRALSAEARESAVKWVGRITEREGTIDRAIPVLRSIVTTRDEDLEVRERAVRTLAALPRGDNELRAVYSQLDHPDLAERAVRVLAEVGGSTNIEFVRSIALDRSEAIDVRERAVRVLGEKYESAAWLRSIVEDEAEHHDIRERALRVMCESGHLPILRTLYARLNDADLKSRVIRLAGEHGTADDIRWIESVALNESEAEEARERAVRVLNEKRVPTAQLASIYDRISNHSVRERLLRLLGERGDRDAIDHLIKVARSSDDGDLRRRAVRILAESRDPRAAEFLNDLVIR